MSKIEEMAEKAFPTKSWEEQRSAYWCRKIYCMGANAVLEEIERTMSVSEDGWLESNLKKLVKELKGE
jgi:hypothetical protein